MLELAKGLIVEYEGVILIIAVISAVVFIVSILLMPFLLGKIPVDYFLHNYQHKRNSSFVVAIKNIIGLILLLVGVVMLIAPGQGVVTILLGLFLMEFSGKRKLELKLINNNATFKTINWLRNTIKKPPLKR